jgi:acetyl-CoA synthase
MSKIIASAAIRGAHKMVEKAEVALASSIEAHGKDRAIQFPDTAYYLPLALTLLGMKVESLGGLEEVLQEARGLLPPAPSETHWLPYLGNTLDAGIATILAEEAIEAMKYLSSNGQHPVQGIWLGATDDVILRMQGIKLVDGRMPGFAACVGAMPTTEDAVKLARELREKNILIFMAGSTDGKTMAEQLAEANVEMGWDTYLVPYGKDISAASYALGFAARSAITFGGITPGGLSEARDILMYNKNRVFAFVLALGEVDDEKYATAAGAINFGFPVIADTDIPQILPTGVCTFEHVVAPVTHDKMVEKAIEVRGVKIQITEVPIPVSYGAAFEGERIRKDDLYLEAGGSKSTALELVVMKQMDQVENGKVTVVGTEVDQLEEGSVTDMAIIVEVAGKKMQLDFEPILERQIHHLVNGAEGVMHIGQRDIAWLRFSKSAVAAGFKFEHLGKIFHAKLLSEYPSIVDKVQVTIYTDPEDVKKWRETARAAYDQRDERVSGMTDDDVDVFYSCTLCQSFAPNHLCVITPQRLGLCGAYNWLDGKASYEISPTGHNQPIAKGETLNAETGEWKDINDYVYAKSNQAVSNVTMYSLMQSPMTSCGCFECIVALLPLCNGVMIVNREYSGMTPSGMKFSTLAGTVGGGNQMPGFIGVGRQYLSSKKFISAEGGFRRIVWMPKELKDIVGPALTKLADEAGESGFLDKIADESVGETEEQIMEFMAQAGHPALSMDPIFS